jgi:fatty-acyl-CoA synthase
MIRAEVLHSFAEALAPSGFREEAFLPSYGMAECSLAISFSSLDKPFEVDVIDSERLSNSGEALPVDEDDDSGRARGFVYCGVPLPSYEVEIRDTEDQPLPDRRAGTIFVRGPSVMSGYFNEPEITAQTLSADGWLNTGDVGYRVDGRLIITGRQKDIIIINGRNIWPQDLEQLAERLPEVRLGAISAFSVTRPNQEELAVMVVESRNAGRELSDELSGMVREHFGINCYIELAPPRTLPRTSSGKLSRARARADFLDRTAWDADGYPMTAPEVQAQAG